VQAHIQSLKDDLIRYCQKDIDVARNRKRINKLGSEFDVAKMYLAHFKQTYEATALRRGAILELVFPPHYVSPVKRLFVILFLTLTIPVLAWSEQAVWQGKVVGVSDGDGVTVMHHGRSVIDPGSSEKHLFI
ncbi:MAG: hypothetical protein KAU38_05140, partial [Desulfobacterales bacterium]|nr:hypothetical protein [Desulfobacterales bacterium]